MRLEDWMLYLSTTNMNSLTIGTARYKVTGFIQNSAESVLTSMIPVQILS